MFNSSIRYAAGQLHCDEVRVADIAANTGTPVYIYSLRRVLENFEGVRSAFAPLDAHIHYSAKANGNLSILRALVDAGAGIDAVSGGEIYRALRAGAPPENIVFAGVSKTIAELYFAVDQNIGWFNLENAHEAERLNSIAQTAGKLVRVAVRLNPDVQASTHPHIATGHGGAKFGLSADAIQALYDRRADLPALSFEGLHIHIGSQLSDTGGTRQAAQAVVELARSMPTINTINIGGGIPVPYQSGAELPEARRFAEALAPVLQGYRVLIEPGRSIVADAGLLVTRVQYLKEQGGARMVIVDAGMTDLIRPALYDAYHAIVPLHEPEPGQAGQTVNVVGPVCETTDMLGRDITMAVVSPNDCLAILTTGAYGMVMSSNYNARPRPPEVVVEPDGTTWRVARRRETWDDLVAHEL
ncbi:MAG: diaminopimelate decarboxylase [Chloroflexi bacterium]|nr:diaminopimelate decarboxylase [Chloroflexota bacterium]